MLEEYPSPREQCGPELCAGGEGDDEVGGGGGGGGRGGRKTIFESIKLFAYNSQCRCCKAHTILKSIRICLCFEGCGGDAFPHIAKTSPSSGCFLKRDFGRSSLLKLRNFKTSIRICLCFEGCGGDSFHQIAKQTSQAGASSSWSSENGPS